MIEFQRRYFTKRKVELIYGINYILDKKTVPVSFFLGHSFLNE